MSSHEENSRPAPEREVAPAASDAFDGNPLWLIVIAMACLFATLTILTVFG